MVAWAHGTPQHPLFFPSHPEYQGDPFTAAKETVPPEKDVKHQLKQAGIFPLSAAGHLPGPVAEQGTGAANTAQHMRQSHMGHQSHLAASTAKLRAEYLTVF